MLWSGLLLGSQATDTLTTALDRAQGALELMPVSAQVLEVGGVALFWVIKLLIVASAAAADGEASARTRQYRPRRMRSGDSRTAECAGRRWRSQACTQLAHVQPGPSESDDNRRPLRVNFRNVARIFLRRSAVMFPPGLLGR